MDIGAPELIILLIVLVVMFGAKKLPELARGSGQALRIFKQEMKAQDDDRSDLSEPDVPTRPEKQTPA
ncbi:MAG: twin-arginine translocase TatA/TatE family subunit [Nocardioides sp.]